MIVASVLITFVRLLPSAGKTTRYKPCRCLSLISVFPVPDLLIWRAHVVLQRRKRHACARLLYGSKCCTHTHTCLSFYDVSLAPTARDVVMNVLLRVYDVLSFCERGATWSLYRLKSSSSFFLGCTCTNAESLPVKCWAAAGGNDGRVLKNTTELCWTSVV